LFFQRLGEKKSFKIICKSWSGIREPFGGKAHAIKGENIPQLETDVTKKMKGNLANSMAGKRLRHAVRRFLKTRSAEQVDVVLGTLSDMDAEASDAAYSHIRYFVWLIPTLGFIGTVIGIGLGIRGFGKIIASAASFSEVQSQIPLVTHDLGIAFDTTLMALFLTSIVLLFSSYSQRRDTDLLAQIDEFCIEEISGSFEEDGMAERIISAIEQQTQAISQSMGQFKPVDLGNIENSMRTAEKCLEQIKKDAAKLNRVMGKLSSKIDGSLDQSVASATQQLEETIRVSSDTSVLKVTLEELKKTASASAEKMNTSFAGFQEKLSQEAEYVRNSFEELMKNLSNLAAVSESLDEAAKAMKGIDVVGKISEIIAQNKDVLEEVKGVLSKTTDSIHNLRDNITEMSPVFTGINQAMAGIHKATQQTMTQIEKLATQIEKLATQIQ